MPLFPKHSRTRNLALKQLESELPLRLRYGNKQALQRLAKKALFILLYVAIACLIGVGLYYGIGKILERGDQFQLKFIKFSTNGVITQAQALEFMEIKGDENIISLDSDALSKKLLNAPGISSAKVIKELPNTLSIELEARLPIVWLECQSAKIFAQDEKNGLFLDATTTSFSFTPRLHNNYRNIPILRIAAPEKGSLQSGDELSATLPAIHLIKLLNREPEDIVPRVLLIEMPTDWSLKVIFQGGIEATFGLYDHEQQIDRLILALNNARRTSRRILTVNLIPTRGTPVTFESNKITITPPPAPPVEDKKHAESPKAEKPATSSRRNRSSATRR